MSSDNADLAALFEKAKISSVDVLNALRNTHDDPVEATMVCILSTVVLAFSVNMSLETLIAGVTAGYEDVESKMKGTVQ